MNRQPQDIHVVSTRGAKKHTGGKSENKNDILRQAALNAARRWGKVVFPLGLVLAALAAVGIWFVIPPQYRAWAIVEIADEKPVFVFPDARERSSQRFVKTQQELLRSTMVMRPVVGSLKNDRQSENDAFDEVMKLEDPVSQLGAMVSFTSRGNSNLYDISYTGPSAENACVIVQAIVKEYFDLRETFDAERASFLIRELDNECSEHEKKVLRLQKEVRDLTKNTPEAGQGLPGGATNVTTNVTSAASPLALLRTRLTDTSVSLAILRAELEATKAIDESNPVEVDEDEVTGVLQERPEVQVLQARIARNQQDLREITSIVKKGVTPPRSEQLTAEIQRNEVLLATTRGELQEEIREEALARLELARAEEIKRQEIELESMGVLEGVLRSQLDDELARTTDVNIDNLELEFKRDEMLRAETVFSLIAQRVEHLQTEQRAPTQVSLRQQATEPTVPVEKYPWKQMVMAGMVAFCLPLLLAVAWEWRTRRLSNSDQVLALSNVPVVGEIASFPAPARANSKALSRRLSRSRRHFNESIHNLRTYLVLSESLSGMKVLAVTSAASQEGKTSVATQLALSYSRANGGVLLIDGDMRSPNVHTIFDVERDPGLAEVLEGKVTLEEAINREWSDDLHILPAGRLSMEPHQLVSNGAISQLLADVQDKYSTIIIDTPPVLAASEALVMARAADATLLCTMRDTSRVAQVKITHGRLVDAGARPVGAVFSGVPTTSYGYTYGRYDYSTEA